MAANMVFVEKSKGISYSKQFDYALFLAVLFLAAIGLIVLSSATKVMPNGINGTRIMIVQAICFLIGIFTAVVISMVDYKDFKTLGMLFYFISLALLVVVIFKGTGGESLGNNNWLKIPLIGSMQPSEIAKVTTVMVVSVFLERIKEGDTDRKTILKLIAYAGMPILLVIAEKDIGTTLVFAFILFVMFFVAGLPYKYIFILSGLMAASTPLLWFSNILNKARKDRIRVFFNPELDSAGAGFNVIRSKIAIGSGKIFGKGLFQGVQTQNMGVPVKESDFIFTVVGEELGFIGAMLIIALMFFILLRCIYIARNSRDQYGSFLAIGVSSMMAFHFIENVGMCIGLLPVTGIPLPFISAGGSSLVTNFIGVGIMLSVSMRRKKTIFNSSQ